jgi:ATP/maltotriose-dependent transcriptional regulator MalT
MLVAPAGYGKTILAQQWLKPQRHAWYRASPSSTDVAALALGLAQTAAELAPQAPRRLTDRLSPFEDPRSHVLELGELVAAELAKWPSNAWLAIDDYHLMMDSEAASAFFTAFQAATSTPMLLTSRRRPEWASARRLLYGEIYELGQAALAMTEAEAHRVLGDVSVASAGGLVALAQGWPAVIGLAAHAHTSIPVEQAMPETLYDYFAEELYNESDAELRLALCAFSIMPSLTDATASRVFGAARADYLLNEAIRLGFVVSVQRGVREMHPLARTFLATKFKEVEVELREDLVNRVFDACLSIAAWDDAYTLIELTESATLLPALVESSLTDVLAASRIATLESWLDFGRRHGVHSPVLELAEAEVSFRQGLHQKTQALAERAADQLVAERPLYAQARLRAGQAAYFNDRHSEALSNFARAKESSGDGAVLRDALWGSFITAIDLEDPSALQFLEAYEQLPEHGADEVIRAATGRLSVGYRQGRLSAALESVPSVLYLVERAEQPMVRSAFWNAYGWALTLNARYKDALVATEHELSEASSYGLDFVVPHAKLVSAHALLGLRSDIQAARLLDEIDLLAKQRRDDFFAVNVRALRARMYLAAGRVRDALAVTDDLDKFPQSRATRGEQLAVRALALLADGDQELALQTARRAIGAAKSSATQVLATLIIAMLIKDSASADQELTTALSQVARTAQFDALVLAYRVQPDLLDRINRLAFPIDLARILRQAQDHPLGRRAGILLGDNEDDLAAKLSPRELEVLMLVAEGRTNAEIARSLYITEVTVKVHVRHILGKLGVRNRAEAAVLVARRQQLAAAQERGPVLPGSLG